MHITLKGRLKRCFRILRRSSAKKSVRPCDWIHGNPKRHPSINHSAHLKGRCHATANGSGKTNPPSPGNVPFRVGRTLRTKTLDELTGVHIRHLLWYVMRAGEEPGPTWLACIHDMLFSGCQVAMLATITWRLPGKRLSYGTTDDTRGSREPRYSHRHSLCIERTRTFCVNIAEVSCDPIQGREGSC